MESTYNLSRFTQAHQMDYTCALQEIRNGRKESHWMWYIFPQLKGFGRSYNSEYYGLSGAEEAASFLADPYLGANLIEICEALLQLPEKDPVIVFDSYIDAQKLRSSMTLFQYVSQNESVFTEVLEKYFNGRIDYKTVKVLESIKSAP